MVMNCAQQFIFRDSSSFFHIAVYCVSTELQVYGAHCLVRIEHIYGDVIFYLNAAKYALLTFWYAVLWTYELSIIGIEFCCVCARRKPPRTDGWLTQNIFFPFFLLFFFLITQFSDSCICIHTNVYVWLCKTTTYMNIFCVNDLAPFRIFQRYRMPKYRPNGAGKNRWHNEREKHIRLNQQIGRCFWLMNGWLHTICTSKECWRWTSIWCPTFWGHIQLFSHRIKCHQIHCPAVKRFHRIAEKLGKTSEQCEQNCTYMECNGFHFRKMIVM